MSRVLVLIFMRLGQNVVHAAWPMASPQVDGTPSHVGQNQVTPWLCLCGKDGGAAWHRGEGDAGGEAHYF
jgi:hypothetical protein